MDKIIKAMAYNKQISITIIKSTGLVSTAQKLHCLSPVACAALGRTLTATAMMTANLKNSNDTLTIQINGGGPLGSVVASGDFGGKVRGYVDNPKVDLPLNSIGKLDVGAAVGNNGNLTILRKDFNGKIYTSSSELVSGEIGEDFAYFFAKSEQSPSAIILGVLVSKTGECISAGGMMINILPMCNEEVISKVESTLPKFCNISTLIAEKKCEEVLNEYFPDSFKTEEISPKFECKCNPTMIEGVISGLTTNDIEEITESHGTIEVICPFCNKSYNFSKDEAYIIINKIKEETNDQ